MNILVSGAGIAGPSVCFWLKRYGFKPILIENAPTLREGGQALDIRGIATGLARNMGIYDKICEKRTRITHGRFVDKQGKILHEEHGETFGFRQDDEVEILRGDIVAILMDQIKDVPCYFNRSIAVLSQDIDGVTVTFNDGSTERFDLVIGADGIFSNTRRLAFSEEEYNLVSLGAYICTFTIPNYLGLRHTELACEADRKYVGVNSDADVTVSLASMMFRSETILKNGRDPEVQKEFLRATFADFGWEVPRLLDYMNDAKDFYFDLIAQVKMNSWNKQRVVLLGDAGYCASPLSGQGNNLAMVGAYILAGELKQAGGDYNVAFKRYDEIMRLFVTDNQNFGAWVSESYLSEDNKKDSITQEERTNDILDRIKKVSNGIVLPKY